MRKKLKSLPRTSGMKGKRQTVGDYIDKIEENVCEFGVYFIPRNPHALLLIDSCLAHISMIRGERRLGFDSYSIQDHLCEIAKFLSILRQWKNEIEREDEEL